MPYMPGAGSSTDPSFAPVVLSCALRTAGPLEPSVANNRVLLAIMTARPNPLTSDKSKSRNAGCRVIRSGAEPTAVSLHAVLLAEQNTTVALKMADFGYILENGRVVMEGTAKELSSNEDVKEFYLGLSDKGRKSFKDTKHYRRRKRWLT